MADPFQTARESGLPTVGYAVLDAPSARDRAIAIMAQQGQALSPRDAARLARRQGVELETARLARASTGFSAAGVPVSSVDYLAGSRLDPRIQRATAMEAERAIEFEPVLRDVQLARARQELDEAAFAMTPTARLAREAEAAARASEALANVRLNQPFQAGELAGSAPTVPVVEPIAEAAPAAATAAPARPATPFDQDRERVVNLAPAERVQAARKQARQALLDSVGPDGLVTYKQIGEAQQQAAEAAMKVQSQKRKFTDPLTRHVFEYDVDVDGLGNVVRVAEPSVSSYDPVTQKIDTEFAVENKKWMDVGRPAAETKIRNLFKAIDNLGKQGFEASLQSGGFAGLPPVRKLADVVFDMPQETERLVLSAAAESLREILGGQFARLEGEQLLQRAYNRYAKEGVNKEFVLGLLDTVMQSATEKDAQAAYFEKNRTLAGYVPRPLDASPEALMERLDKLAKTGKSQTPTQQAASAGLTAAQQAAAKYHAKRRGTQAPVQQ
jgi:hypothetical protein